ncbi:hypothetical protein ACQ4PT_002193 [Festuca glaucescens]
MSDRVAASLDAPDMVATRPNATRAWWSAAAEGRRWRLATRGGTSALQKEEGGSPCDEPLVRRTYLELWISSVQLNPISPFAFTKLDDIVSPHATEDQVHAQGKLPSACSKIWTRMLANLTKVRMVSFKIVCKVLEVGKVVYRHRLLRVEIVVEEEEKRTWILRFVSGWKRSFKYFEHILVVISHSQDFLNGHWLRAKRKTPGKMERGGLAEKFADVTFGYTPDNLIYKNLDFGVDLDSRVALAGPSGAGKSTLLNLMTCDLTPLDGMVRRLNHLRIAQFHPHLTEKLDLEPCNT